MVTIGQALRAKNGAHHLEDEVLAEMIRNAGDASALEIADRQAAVARDRELRRMTRDIEQAWLRAHAG